MKKLLLSLILLAGASVICFGGFTVAKGYNYYRDALEEKSLTEMAADIRSNGNYTDIDQMPQIYKNAVIAVEDKRFYDHSGIDLIAIGRAVYHDIKAGSFVEGGSTITQQLAKNQYFSQDKDITRKIAEVFMAIDMEKKFTKDEILELYLNSIYFGDGYYCVADAANGYFGKSPNEMTDDEATLLAGVPNAPSVYAPTVNPELARKRQKQVVAQMIDCGFLDDVTVAQALETFKQNASSNEITPVNYNEEALTQMPKSSGILDTYVTACKEYAASALDYRQPVSYLLRIFPSLDNMLKAAGN